MTKFSLTMLALLLTAAQFFAQSSPILTIKRGVDNFDLDNILDFQDIDYEKFAIRGAGLKGKNFKVLVKEFKNGQLTKTDIAFDSKEDQDYFKIKSDSLKFVVMTQVDANHFFKLVMRFNGFGIDKRYKVDPDKTGEFALKDFLGPKTETTIDLSGPNYLLAYMTAFVRKDGSTSYCEVAQSGMDPEKLWDKYAIPHYFLVVLEFSE
jgi:hypothetical protein